MKPFRILALLLSLFSVQSEINAQDCVPVPAGLVGWWNADGDTVPSDLSGYGNDGSGVNVGVTSGMVDTAFVFDGATTAITVPQSPGLNTKSLTFAAWINPADWTPRPVMEYGDNFVGVLLWVNVGFNAGSPGTLAANVREGIGLEHTLTATNVIPTNQWSFVALTYDNPTGTGRLYVNGQLVRESYLGSFQPMTSNGLNIGHRPQNNQDGDGFNGRHFAGKLDEVQVYSHALTHAELSSIYNAGSAGVCKTNGVPLPHPPATLFISNRVPTRAPIFDIQGDLLDGSRYLAQVYSAGSDSVFRPSGPAVPFSTGTNAGYFEPINLLFPEIIPGRPVRVKLLVWDSVAGVSYEEVAANGGARSSSAILENITGGGDLPAPPLQGLTSFSLVAPPRIIGQPASKTVFVGENVTFEVQASGATALDYQWRFNSNVISGATSAFLTLTNVQLAQAGNYTVRVSNSVGDVTSEPAVLTVRVPEPPPQECVVAPAGLVGWWSADGLSEIVPGNRLAVNDWSGQGNHGGGTNMVFANGKVNAGFQFDGRSTSITIPASPSLDVRSLTLAAWINPADYANRPIMEYGDDFVGVMFWVNLGFNYNAPGALAANVRQGVGLEHTLVATNVISTNEWSFVALTYDYVTGIGRLYANGKVVQESNLGSFVPMTSTPLNIGRRSEMNRDGGEYPGMHFAGKMDEVQVYNRALSPVELNTIYKAGSAGVCKTQPLPLPHPNGLAAYYPLNGTALDYSGNGLDGTIVGASSVTDRFGNEKGALQFNGISDYVNLGNRFNFESNFTLNAWVQLTNPSPYAYILGKYYYAGQFVNASHAYGLGTDEAGVHPYGFVVGDGVFYDEIRTSNFLTDSNWHSLSLVYDRAFGAILYMDGQPIGSNSASGLPPFTNSYPLFIGKIASGSNFQGNIDDVSLHNVALSSEEIAQLYREQAGDLRITSQPESKTVFEGNEVTFRVLASGAAVLGYQWMFNGNDIAGATFASLTLTNVQVAEAGEYTVRVSNSAGSVSSAPAVLTVLVPDRTPPSIVISSPAEGGTEVEVVTLSGRITDNVAIGNAGWTRNGVASGPIELKDGGFSVTNIVLARGTNVFRVFATDTSGNESSTSVVVVLQGSRTLSIGKVPAYQEGSQVSIPVQFTSRGDVAGIAFTLNYDRNYLEDPQVTWGELLGGAFVQVNTNALGNVRASFALSGIALPEGTQLVCNVTFHARSVPSNVQVPLLLSGVGVFSVTGDSLTLGTDIISGMVSITKRKYVGDNNANDRLDVGDASAIMRLVTLLEAPRFWDTSANDLNKNQLLDVGDVIRVLRAVVGLDPQPGATGALPLSALSVHSLAAKKALATVSLDKQRAVPGEKVKLTVNLSQFEGPVSGLSFKLRYPVAALRLDDAQAHRLGAIVPANAVTLWNLSPSQNDYAKQDGVIMLAVSSDGNWKTNNGPIAEFTFTVQNGATNQYRWPVELSALELSSGYDLIAGADSAVSFVGRDPLPGTIQGTLNPVEGTFTLSLTGDGARYVIEVSEDLQAWSELSSSVNDPSQPITDPQTPQQKYRFYRAKLVE